VVTCRALKMHGGVDVADINVENVEALNEGMSNIKVHVENLAKFNVPVVVAVNRFPQDTPAELDAVFAYCEKLGVEAALSEVAARGGEGGLELADKVLAAIEINNGKENPFSYTYDENASIKEKIEAIATQIYRADGVDYEDKACEAIGRLEKHGFDKKPICMAKTQLSVSDDPKKLGAPTGWRLTVRDLRVSNGANFIVAITGKMMLMPGMPKQPATAKIGMNEKGEVYGLS